MKKFVKLSLIVHNLRQARQIVTIINRSFSGKAENLNDNEKEIKATFEPIMEKLARHPAKNPSFFSYLQRQSERGFNCLQFMILRDNILARTQLTIPTVAYAVATAALNDDNLALAKNGQNLTDELGKGDPNKVHSKMIVDAFDIHSQIVFGLPPLRLLSQSLQSPHLTPELFEYREMKMKAFSGSYPYISGNLLAHEYYADDWLDNIKKYVFESYREYYQGNEEEYDKAMAFFLAHKDDKKKDGNVEEMHNVMAQESAVNLCKKDPQKLKEVEQGAMDFANAQARLWNSLMREIEKAEGKPIAPKPLFRNNEPNVVVKAEETKNINNNKNLPTDTPPIS